MCPPSACVELRRPLSPLAASTRSSARLWPAGIHSVPAGRVQCGSHVFGTKHTSMHMAMGPRPRRGAGAQVGTRRALTNLASARAVPCVLGVVVAVVAS